jgi:hypothetical protein
VAAPTSPGPDLSGGTGSGTNGSQNGSSGGGNLPSWAARSRIFGSRTSIGAAEAAKAVAEDASALVRAEIALAKAEITGAAKAKASGAGLLVGAAVLGWLGLQGLLVTAGIALALVLPAWAAALIVTGVLLLLAAVLGLVGKGKLATPVKLETTKQNVEEDVAWTKAHLSRREPPSEAAGT